MDIHCLASEQRQQEQQELYRFARKEEEAVGMPPAIHYI